MMKPQRLDHPSSAPPLPGGAGKDGLALGGGLLQVAVDAHDLFREGRAAQMQTAVVVQQRPPQVAGVVIKIVGQNPGTDMNVLDGIKQGLMPPKAVNRNVYEMTDEERKIFGIEKLPGSLREAAIEFQKDTFIQEILGEDLSKKYIEAKTREYYEYRIQITDWELEKYLHLL